MSITAIIIGFRGSAKDITYPLIKLHTKPNLNPLKNFKKLKLTKGEFNLMPSLTITGASGYEKFTMKRPKSALAK